MLRANPNQSRAGQSRAGQSRAGQGRAGQGGAGRSHTVSSNAQLVPQNLLSSNNLKLEDKSLSCAMCLWYPSNPMRVLYLFLFLQLQTKLTNLCLVAAAYINSDGEGSESRHSLRLQQEKGSAQNSWVKATCARLFSVCCSVHGAWLNSSAESG